MQNPKKEEIKGALEAAGYSGSTANIEKIYQAHSAGGGSISDVIKEVSFALKK